MRKLAVAATQMSCTWDLEANLVQAEELVRSAAAQGAQVVLLQELFATPYFCKDQNPAFFAHAVPYPDNPLLDRFRCLARELEIVLPISFFERANAVHFNSLAMIDADGKDLGLYRKSHIPDGPGYQEKFYFSPGDTGFRVWSTAYGVVGAAICWDQWFPECARAMALAGAEVLLYPTAIGSEPSNSNLETVGPWQRAMQGHSAANTMPLVASNRIGTESGDACDLTFYGHSFIADETGAIVAEIADGSSTTITAVFDLDEIAEARAAFGLFRDRRPEFYGVLQTYDGFSIEAG